MSIRTHRNTDTMVSEQANYNLGNLFMFFRSDLVVCFVSLSRRLCLSAYIHCSRSCSFRYSTITAVLSACIRSLHIGWFLDSSVSSNRSSSNDCSSFIDHCCALLQRYELKQQQERMENVKHVTQQQNKEQQTLPERRLDEQQFTQLQAVRNIEKHLKYQAIQTFKSNKDHNTKKNQQQP